jgi:hypothetical protein
MMPSARRSRAMGAALACLAAFAAGCDDDSPTAPSGTAVIRAAIAASREVPPIAGPEADATGTVTITLSPTRDGDGIVTGGTLAFTMDLSGFPAGTRLTAAHIHVGGAAANGVIIQDTGLAARGGATLASGSGTITIEGIPVSALVANALLANPAAYYFNVHSELNPAGAARGQLAFP